MGQSRCKHLRRIRVVDKSRKAWALTLAEMTDWLRERKAAIQDIGAHYYGSCAWRNTTRCYNEKHTWRSPRVMMTGFVNQAVGAREGVTELHVDDCLYHNGNEVRFDSATQVSRPLH
jgi:hypothetical protein